MGAETTVELTFLGTGTSTGVPVIGCDCRVCRSPDPRDTRLRCSVAVRSVGTTVLVDASPDLRAQVLRDPIDRLDAILMTHEHADHTAGLDELRRYNAMQQQHLPVHADATTLAAIRQRFAYAFADLYPAYGLKPDLTPHTIGGAFTIGDLDVVPVPVMHGRMPILGYRFGPIAYLTDVKTIPDASRALLQGLDVLILTALRQQPHPAHLALDEAIALAGEIGARHTLFTHVAHDMGRHAEVAPTLPDGIGLAHDRLRVVVDTGRVGDGRVRFMAAPEPGDDRT